MPARSERVAKYNRLLDRKSTRLNSSHSQISYAVFCLKKKSKRRPTLHHILGSGQGAAAHGKAEPTPARAGSVTARRARTAQQGYCTTTCHHRRQRQAA